MTSQRIGYAILIILALVAPAIAYPVFLMKALCFALFACAFNLLLGYAGLLSFGHAAFFGGAAYIGASLAKDHGLSPELANDPGWIYALDAAASGSVAAAVHAAAVDHAATVLARAFAAASRTPSWACSRAGCRSAGAFPARRSSCSSTTLTPAQALPLSVRARLLIITAPISPCSVPRPVRLIS